MKKEMVYGFKEMATQILEECKKPMSVDEIWDYATKNGLDKKVGTQGKTPWKSIGAQIYLEINNKGDDSRFKQVSTRPALFALNNQTYSNTIVEKRQREAEIIDEPKYNERELHAVLVKYLNSESYFSCKTKTVFHEKSDKGTKNQNKWVHPDLIGVYFPYTKNNETTTKVLEVLSEKSYKIFSFEMKKSIDTTHLREYYFQAVSNSSWANEGYLVAPEISNDTKFLEDLSILCNAFGIGVIKLNIEIPEQSEILFYSKKRNELDINMLDRLISINENVKIIFDSIIESNKLERLVGEDKFDKVMTDEEYEKYKKEKFNI